MQEHICSMITVFNADITQTKSNINEILKYAEKIYLLFNSTVQKELLFDDRICAIDNGGNIGLSKAFNIALIKAREEGFSTSVLFDQDSFLTQDSFNTMYIEFVETKKSEKVMCIGPGLRVYGQELETPKWVYYKKLRTEIPVISVKNIITSGMILDINAALEIGGFEDSFPVDFCDFYFCYKAIYNGYYVLKSKDAFIQHEIGNSNMKIGKSTIHFHAPYRNYFLVRDTLRIVFRCKETPFSIRFRYIFFLPLRMLLFLIKLDKKKERLRMYHLGFRDYIHKNYYFGSIASILNAK